MTYVEYGTPSGTPVVFLHGTPGSRVLGQLFDDAARQRDVRLLALDRPGFGNSDPWPTRTLADTGEFVAAVLEDADIASAGVIGFSGGGPHALALAATRPDLVNSVDVVAGAPPPSLADCTPRVQCLLRWLARSAPRVLKGLVRGQAWLADRTTFAVVVSQYTSDEGAAEASSGVSDVVGRDFVEALARRRQGFVTETRLLGEEWGFSVAEVDSRVRLWHGGADTNVPVAGVRRLAEELPNSQLSVFDGADHLTTLSRSRTAVLARHSVSDEGQ